MFTGILAHHARISIHALLAESDLAYPDMIICTNVISIHALLAESDRYSLRYSASDRHFYPRSPCGERRPRLYGIVRHIYFYPRSPCGERLHIVGGAGNNTIHFYPRSPCGERRRSKTHDRHKTTISIHALLAESDRPQPPKARVL